MFVRQAAWLNTVPEKQSAPRRDTKGDHVPPLSAGHYLVELLFEIGPVDLSADGRPTPICDNRIFHWQRNQGVPLSSWDSLMLIRMSKEYAAMLVQARSQTCPPPWVPQEILLDQERAEKIAKAMSEWADKLNASTA